MNDLKELCEACLPIVKNAGRFIYGEIGKVKNASIEEKSVNSLVSYVDKQSEEKLVNGLSELLPDSVFLTEEDTVSNQAGEWQWIVDPLDGTTNFLHGIPCFAVSVGLRYREELVVGIVYEVSRNECFYAWKDGGAFLDGKPISTRKNTDLRQAIIATGFPYYDYSHMEGYMEALRHLMRNSRGLRRMGAAAVDLAYVACGRFDAFFEYSLHAWDVAGGALLITEAGGQLSDFKGGKKYLFGQEIIAGSSPLHEELLDIIRRSFLK
ncbi:MAG: inositol monophosphatase family protein [Saprospiraceae bacterium]|nr:inositol monophosphatase family protein [Saprospiraceae bacterium]